jgi:hypothetical protein
MNFTDDPAMRGLVLGFLYASKEHNWTLVKPEKFNPPMKMGDIARIGRELKEAELIKGQPSNNGDGYFMQISAHGHAVWEGREDSPLEIEVPPS